MRTITYALPLLAALVACSAPTGDLGPLPDAAADVPPEAAADAPADAPDDAVGPCPQGFGNCNGDGTCFRLADNAMHCGACGRRCPAHATCTAGMCRSPSGLTCQHPNADCDNSEATGCETQLQGSHTNCGACGNDCRARGLWCRSGACAE